MSEDASCKFCCIALLVCMLLACALPPAEDRDMRHHADIKVHRSCHHQYSVPPSHCTSDLVACFGAKQVVYGLIEMWSRMPHAPMHKQKRIGLANLLRIYDLPCHSSKTGEEGAIPPHCYWRSLAIMCFMKMLL